MANVTCASSGVVAREASRALSAAMIGTCSSSAERANWAFHQGGKLPQRQHLASGEIPAQDAALDVGVGAFTRRACRWLHRMNSTLLAAGARLLGSTAPDIYAHNNIAVCAQVVGSRTFRDPPGGPRQFESTENIKARLGCQVVGGSGDGRLEYLVPRDTGDLAIPGFSNSVRMKTYNLLGLHSWARGARRAARRRAVSASSIAGGTPAIATAYAERAWGIVIFSSRTSASTALASRRNGSP